ncbi:hypothetical protein ABZS88_15515 [Streptomyces sp. NPDC005480]|uniref:hypothetical protein n=1 Tax=Streptomyces sp. NPDC005480 TaxID=3154880 RepID=UPI0033BE3503
MPVRRLLLAPLGPWKALNVVATGGRQGGSAGAIGTNVAAANSFYSDENDYTGYDPVTGVPIPVPDKGTAPDSHGQVLAHKTWNGRSAQWSDRVVDVAGLTGDRGDGTSVIGGGRPDPTAA